MVCTQLDTNIKARFNYILLLSTFAMRSDVSLLIRVPYLISFIPMRSSKWCCWAQPHEDLSLNIFIQPYIKIILRWCVFIQPYIKIIPRWCGVHRSLSLNFTTLVVPGISSLSLFSHSYLWSSPSAWLYISHSSSNPRAEYDLSVSQLYFLPIQPRA